MSRDLRASIIINNYNYGRFLAEAIESALNQTYANTEVIVVDDGSTDNSREIITTYGDKIISVLKENGGQTSALNAGFRTAQGEIVCFLDADDILLPTVVEKSVNLFQDSKVVKVHWSMETIDAGGRKTGNIIPSHKLPDGDLRNSVISAGPDCFVWSPTSGNAWKREFLEKVFPLPEMEKEYNVGSDDAYLSMFAPLFGRIKRIEEPQGFYRLHGQNGYSAMSFDKKLKRDLQFFDYRSAVLSNYCQEIGIMTEPERWKENSWFYLLHQATQDIAKLVEPKEAFILVDDNGWVMESTEDRRIIPFLEKDGQYWGAPPDDETAIRELERLRQEQASFIVIVWTSFWWLDYYTGFNRYLRSKFQCVLENDRLIVFDLRKEID